MKKILLTILLFSTILYNSIFAFGQEYTIKGNHPDIIEIKVNALPYNSLETNTYVFINGVTFMNRTVSVLYNSKYSGIVQFNGRLINTDRTLQDCPFSIVHNVTPGINNINNFYQLPTQWLAMNTAEWKNFYNVLVIENIIPINAVETGYIISY